MSLYDRFKYCCSALKSNVPGNAFEGMTTAPAHLRIKNTITGILNGIMQIHSFGTEHAPVHRMVLVSFYSYPAFAIFFNYNATTHSAIGTRCLCFALNSVSHRKCFLTSE